VPASFNEPLGHAGVPDMITDDELESLRQGITRDVTAALMFGGPPAPEIRQTAKLERAAAYLNALARQLLARDDAPAHLARIAEDPGDVDGALRFGCLLHLAREPEGATWWWQFAAGAGDATAAYCLYLMHLDHGELRDAGHWISQALSPDSSIDFIPPLFWMDQSQDPSSGLLREAVARLKVEDVAGAPFHRPEHHLADRSRGLGLSAQT
jgi:TPR repeat protein